MNVLNFLEFLNKADTLNALDYARCNSSLVDLLKYLSEDEQFTFNIDLGIMYYDSSSLEHYTIVDGLNRILSLSLLLHAICECHKKTTPRNEKAIRMIRKKYLLHGTKTKLKLDKASQEIYEKIIYGERLSGKEKESQIFLRLHKYWSQIKEEGLQASNIFKMLQKIRITLVNTDNVNTRDLYYNLNKDTKTLAQLDIIENYMKEYGVKAQWEDFKEIYKNKNNDIKLFFKDFFAIKFNFKVFEEKRLYEMYVNYFETMLKYKNPEQIMANVIKSAGLYKDILNLTFENKKVKDAFINIKMHQGEDTYAYLLNIYEDFRDGNITEGTFLEILSTINEYLKNRSNNPNDVSFNELVRYLNAFITCK